MKIRDRFGAAAAIAVLGLMNADAGFLERKIAALEKFASANQAALRGYQWSETVRFLMKDVLKSTSQFSCRYGADGRVERTPVGPPAHVTAGPFDPGKNDVSREEIEATS